MILSSKSDFVRLMYHLVLTIVYIDIFMTAKNGRSL